jgi:hypothetical protein
MEKTKKLCGVRFKKWTVSRRSIFSKCTGTTKEKDMLYKIFFDFIKKIGAGFLYLASCIPKVPFKVTRKCL